MTTRIVYAYTSDEAADLSGDPWPERLPNIPADMHGRIPYLIDDAAHIALEPDDAAHIPRIIEYAVALTFALAAGYLIGRLYMNAYGA